MEVNRLGFSVSWKINHLLNYKLLNNQLPSCAPYFLKINSFLAQISSQRCAYVTAEHTCFPDACGATWGRKPASAFRRQCPGTFSWISDIPILIASLLYHGRRCFQSQVGAARCKLHTACQLYHIRLSGLLKVMINIPACPSLLIKLQLGYN